jgi:serine/threonine protein kinase
VYSFGVLLFWMRTGRPPFLSESPMELLQLHRDAAPPAVSGLRDDAPADLAALTAAALARDPSARPADGAALLQQLAPASATVTLPLTPVPSAQPRRRLTAAALVALVLAGLGAAGTAVAFAVSGDSGTQAPAATAGPTPKLPKPNTAVATTGVTTPTSGTTQATASTAAPTTTARPRPTTQAATTAPAPPREPATTSLLTTTDVTTTAPPPTSPPLQGTTTVGSAP